MVLLRKLFDTIRCNKPILMDLMTSRMCEAPYNLTPLKAVTLGETSWLPAVPILVAATACKQ